MDCLVPCDLCHGEPLRIDQDTILTCPMCMGQGYLPGINVRVLVGDRRGETYLHIDDLIKIMEHDGVHINPEGITIQHYTKYLADRLRRLRQLNIKGDLP